MTEILKPKQYIIGDLKLERAREKLRNALAIAPLDRFLRMLWCAEALRTERKAAAAPFIRFAPEAAYQDIRSEHAIHPWELETLATQALLVERKPLRRFYTCDNIATVGMFVNLLRNLENEEFRVESERIHILNEMHRIGQRQFPWQRGNANMPDFYRSLYLYGQGSCAEYFALSYNITVSEFSLLGFALFAMFLRAPNVELPLNLIDIDLNTEKVEAGLLLLAVHISQSANLQRKLVSQGAAAKWPIAYQPSVLRRSPILKMGRGSETLIAPLPNLVLQRVTFELYYGYYSVKWSIAKRGCREI